MKKILEKIEKIIGNSKDYNISVYFIKKDRSSNYSAYTIPDNFNEKIKENALTCLQEAFKDKKIVKYDFLHKEKDSIEHLSTLTLNEWPKIKGELNDPNKIRKKKEFTNDFSFSIIKLVKVRDNNVSYLISKYIKPTKTYKNSIKFAITTNSLKEVKDEIITLNIIPDVYIDDTETLIFNHSTFASIFKYSDVAKKIINSSKDAVKSWDILDSVDGFYEKILSSTNRIQRMATAIEKSTTDWKNVPKEKIREVIESEEIFKNMSISGENKLVCTNENVDLLIDIFREVYCKQLFTEEIIETKGV